jgi:hypothetical protein
MALGLNDLMVGNPLFGPFLEGVGPENLDFFGPICMALASLKTRVQKSPDFHCPPISYTVDPTERG